MEPGISSFLYSKTIFNSRKTAKNPSDDVWEFIHQSKTKKNQNRIFYRNGIGGFLLRRAMSRRYGVPPSTEQLQQDPQNVIQQLRGSVWNVFDDELDIPCIPP